MNNDNDAEDVINAKTIDENEDDEDDDINAKIVDAEDEINAKSIDEDDDDEEVEINAKLLDDSVKAACNVGLTLTQETIVNFPQFFDADEATNAE